MNHTTSEHPVAYQPAEAAMLLLAGWRANPDAVHDQFAGGIPEPRAVLVALLSIVHVMIRRLKDQDDVDRVLAELALAVVRDNPPPPHPMDEHPDRGTP
ncbi:MAG: hypothetical protein ACYCU5_13230 [Actinomycetes bacterium]